MLGRDPLGAKWRMADTELRMRLDAVSTPPRIGGGHGSGFRSEAGVPGSLGALSLTHDCGKGRVLFGYRVHPGWPLGLYARDGESGGGMGWIEPGTFTDDDAFANPFLGFARNGASFGYTAGARLGAFRVAAFRGTAQYGERRDADSAETTGALAEYRFGRSGVAVQAGWIAEAEAAVGGRPIGAFGSIASDSVIAGLSASRRLSEGWRLLASAHAGLSRPRIRREGMLQGLSAPRTSSFALGLIGEEIDRAGGRLALRASQPLRLEAGRASLGWVSGRTPDGELEIEQASASLEPSGRQVDFELTYSRPWVGGRAHLAAIASHDAGHVKGEHEAALLMRYSRAFW